MNAFDIYNLQPLKADPAIIIAIDGFSSCGKSSTAKAVASRLRYAYIDTGAMYRAVTLFFLKNGITYESTDIIKEEIHNIKIQFHLNRNAETVTYLNGVNVEKEIRSMYISNFVSKYSSIKYIRQALVHYQRKLGEGGGIVMDGRDIGTNVFPNADLKIFMTADVLIRAKRRQLEFSLRGDQTDLHEIIENLQKRDCEDLTRQESPLCQAPDSVLIDTSLISFKDQVDTIVNLAHQRAKKILM